MIFLEFYSKFTTLLKIFTIIIDFSKFFEKLFILCYFYSSFYEYCVLLFIFVQIPYFSRSIVPSFSGSRMRPKPSFGLSRLAFCVIPPLRLFFLWWRKLICLFTVFVTIWFAHEYRFTAEMKMFRIRITNRPTTLVGL